MVLPSVGSSGAIKGVLRQRLEIGITSGPLKPEYREKGLRDFRYGGTPTVIVNGRYRVLGHDFEEMLHTTDWLVARERQARASP